MNPDRPPLEPDANSRAPNAARDRPLEVRWRFSILAHAAIVLSAAIAVFLAAGPPQGSLGIFLTLAGLTMLAFPPVARISWKLWTAAIAFVGCGALALLPAGWFPAPLWRTQLAQSPIIALSSTVSASPWETGFWLSIVAISICIGLFLLSHPIRSAGMMIVAAGASLICAVYGGMAIVAKLSGWKYPFASAATFGFFPNRNHTATFLVTGTLLALAVLGVAYRRRHWIAGGVATASVAVCAASLGLFSESRGGIVFVALGAVIWVVGLGRRHRDRRFALYTGAFALLVVVAFIFSGSVVRDRVVAMFQHAAPAKHVLSTSGETGEEPTFDARLLVYQDALRMVRDFPWTGSGLGTFAWVFPQYEKAALSDSTSIHPESDWMMLADEAGIPATVCAVVLLLLLFRGAVVSRAHPYWPLRWGCMIAVAAALLHGLVDVPVHRVALGWWILALAGLAFQTEQAGRCARFGAQRAVFALAGIASIGLGVQLMRAEWFKGEPLPPFYVRTIEKKITGAYAKEAFEEAYNIAEAGRHHSPMAADLYFQEGYFRLYFRDAEEEVDGLFGAQRRLTPNWPGVPLEQARVWSSLDPKRAADLWTEVFNRRQRIDKAEHAGEALAVGEYEGALSEATAQPELQKLLLRESGRGPSFALAAARTVAPALAGAYIDQLSGDETFLRRLSAGQRAQFISAWEQRGSKESLASFVLEHPEWKKPAR